MPRRSSIRFASAIRDPVSGVRARYRASRSEIAARYAGWEITWPGEVRESIGGSFSPHGKLIAHNELKRLSEPALQFHPHLEAGRSIDGAEVFLVRLFLRRYVTYCAQRGRYAQMNGAADLFRELRTVGPLRST